MKMTKSLLIVTLACGTLWAQAPTPAPTGDQSKQPANTATPAAKNATPKTSAAAPAKTPAAAPAKAAAATTAKAPAPAPTTAAKPATATAGKPATTAAAPAKPAAPKPATPTNAKGTTPVAGKAVPTPVKTPAPPAKAPPSKTQAAKAPATKPVANAKAKPAPVVASKPKTDGPAKPASAKETTTATRVGKQRDPFVSPVVRSGGNVGSGCDTGKRCLVVDQIVLKGIVKSPAGFIAVVENPAKRAYFMRENDPVFNGKVTKITGDTVVFQEEVMDKLGKQSMREVVKKVNAPVV